MEKIVGGAETKKHKWNFIVRLEKLSAGATILERYSNIDTRVKFLSLKMPRTGLRL